MMVWRTAAVTLIASAFLAPALGQDAGRRLTGFLTQGVEVDSNFDLDPVSEGTSIRSVTGVGIEYQTQTNTESFRLTSDVSMRILRDPDGDTDVEFTLPTVGLSYAREASRAALELGADFRETPVDFLRPGEGSFDEDGVFIPPDETDVTEGTGSRRDYGVAAALTFGVDTPIETRVSAAADFVEYSNADVDDNDSETFTLSSQSSLRISPVLAGTVGVTATRRSIDDVDQTQRDTVRLRFGVDYAASRNVSYTAGVGYVWRETEEAGTTTQSDGLLADVGVAYQLKNSSFGANVGFETTVDDERVATGSLNYRYELPRANIRAALQRSLRFSNDGTDEAVTSARVDYSRQINSISDANLGLSYSLTENLDDPTVADEERLTLRAGYTRALSEDVNLDLGYAYRLRTEDPLPDAESHNLSLSIRIPFNF